MALFLSSLYDSKIVKLRLFVVELYSIKNKNYVLPGLKIAENPEALDGYLILIADTFLADAWDRI